MDPSALEKLLAASKNNLMVRFGLGSAYLKQDKYNRAIEHFAAALRHDNQHSASWKLYGKALASAGETAHAIAAYGEGIAQAVTKGDI